MVGETTAFFREVLDSGLTLREFLHSDWTMVNSRLAQFYGLPDDGRATSFSACRCRPTVIAAGCSRRRRSCRSPPTARGIGPVHRGKWVSESIFGKSPPPPPANVDPIEPNPVDSPKATLRMKLEAHIHDAQLCLVPQQDRSARPGL